MNDISIQRLTITLSMLLTFLLLLTACGGSTGPAVSTATASVPPRLAARQVLTFPNVGLADSAALDPATVTDTNTNLIVSMVYSGLVKLDSNLFVVPDQATWRVSSDNKIYTFDLKPGIAFADG
ncbi:MAG TPA: peptide ABC transporter substrate-binding protein, partial [Ktedonobacteraceae bacterium]|nr:peptide ABC transporter substrate-binding protein [Ktedonobacteraceae bacterium]